MLPVKKFISQAMEIQFTTRIFKERRTFVAHALELDVSSCGGNTEKALTRGRAAVPGRKRPRRWGLSNRSSKRPATA
jgi:hypothetical protein